MEPKLLTADRFVDMRTGCSYRYVHSSTEYFRPHYHDYYEIFIPLDGNAVHLVNGARIPLKKGMAVLVRPSDTHDYVCKSGEIFYMLNITFTQETADAIFSFLGAGFDSAALHQQPLPPVALLSEQQLSSLREQMTHIRTIGDGDADRLRTALRTLLFRLITEHFSSSDLEADNRIPLWLTELCERMREDGNFVKGSDAMWELTEKSREHVSRSMKKYLGMTVSEYINELRLHYIANMLQYSDHKILDIVFESGFNNVSWCCKCFSKKYGMNMSEYRRVFMGKEKRTGR